MASIVVLDLIKGAMRLIGAIEAGETPSVSESADALVSLNELLEQWALEQLMVTGGLNTTFNTVAGQANYTIGVGGQANIARPTSTNIHSAYCTFGGVDFPIGQIGLDEYNLIDLKTQQQPIVERLVYLNDYPLGRLILFPVPSQVIPIVMNYDAALTAFTSISQTVDLQVGLTKALRTNLACHLAAEYGRDIPQGVIVEAMATKASYKRANRPKLQMRVDDTLLGGSGSGVWQRGY